jgi:outer membrane receptor protein involved in Fe transport
VNARASYTWKSLTTFLRLNNLTDNKYQTYGVLGGFPTQPNFMPAAGINVLGGLTIRFENYY